MKILEENRLIGREYKKCMAGILYLFNRAVSFFKSPILEKMPFQKKKVSCHSNSVLEPPHRPNLAELYLLLNCTNYSFDKRKEDVK